MLKKTVCKQQLILQATHTHDSSFLFLRGAQSAVLLLVSREWRLLMLDDSFVMGARLDQAVGIPHMAVSPAANRKMLAAREACRHMQAGRLR